MPRLFAALEIPRGTSTALSFLKGGLPAARWIDPENHHITLRFIGDVSHRDADDICVQLESITLAPFMVDFEGLGIFGSKMPHSVFARVKPNDALKTLHHAIDRKILRLGHAPDGRRFTPHVTLARTKNAKAVDVVRYMTERGGAFIPKFVASRFVLLSSRDSVGGGPYALEAEFPLLQEGALGGAYCDLAESPERVTQA